jgi:putative heme-binding domain-containing protein
MLRRIFTLVSVLCLANAAFAADPVPEWIWSSDKPKDGEVVYFRKSFNLNLPQGSAAPKSAFMIVTCDNRWTVYFNGEKVSTGEEWQQPARVDLLKLLKNEKNVIAVEGKNDSGAAGLLVRLTITWPDDKKEMIVSDPSWIMSPTKADGWQQASFKDDDWKKVYSLGKYGTGPWGDVIAGQPGVGGPPGSATTADSITTLPGYKVELLYSVPKGEQGSWVNMCFDDKGRIITSNQNGILYRVTLDKPEKGKVQVEPIEVRTKPEAQPIGKAHGLLYAFNSLYVMIADGAGEGNGLYRLRSTKGDDKYDSAELLRKLNGGGEHGPHAIRLSPDGKSLYVICGNFTKLTDIDSSRVVKRWGEDHLVPRMPDGNNFARDIMAPGGWIAKLDPDAKNWELVCSGFRNPFDFDFNPDGELFTWDADMEWDIGTPWYRPTRICHCVSGGEFGWRNGSGKWPEYYPDSLPPTVNVGLGSPTGMEFGTHAKFPAKYQQALYGLDWTYGILYAFHLHPSGASYIASPEKFLSGKPLPLTDMAFGPDGAMYFTIGGRGTQSGLYRVTYVGKESTEPAKPKADLAAVKARELRHQLEEFHGKQDPKAVEFAWPHLKSADRFIRYAARTAIEHQPVEQWQAKALAEKDPESLITIMVALARCGDKSLEAAMINALNSLEWKTLTEMQRLELLRAYSLVFVRMGKPSADQAKSVIDKLNPQLPAGSYEVDRELSGVLLALDAPGAVAKTMTLLKKTEIPREQIAYAYNLRPIKDGWTPELRKTYFEWYLVAATYKGGNSFAPFIRNMKAEAVALLLEDEKTALAEVLNAKPINAKPVEVKPRPFVKEWAATELVPIVESGLKQRDYANGRALFTAARCAQCHHFDGDGGPFGPDLTGVAGRFSIRDLTEKLCNPNKAIADLYQSTVLNLKDGKQIQGRIIGEQGGKIQIITDANKLDQITNVDAANVESREVSKVSFMPVGLLNTLNKEEILDLVAYLLSGGDRGYPAFK